MMDTRTALLDLAEDFARARGYEGFSYADLAAGVGIRKASIHYHFPTKPDLALAILHRYTERFAALLGAISAGHEPAADRLANYVAANRQALDGGERLCLCVALGAGSHGLDERILAGLDAFHADTTSWLRSVFALGQQDGSIAQVDDPQNEALACLALMQGAQLLARTARDPAQFDHAITPLLTRLER